MRPTDLEYIVLDVETTGLSPTNGDRIVEIAAVKVRGRKIIDTFDYLINPQRLIPLEAQRINNITDDMVSQAPSADEILPKLISFVAGASISGHNIKFDLNFICYQLSLCGRKLNDSTPVCDTLKMARLLVPQLSSYTLGNVAQYFGLRVQEAHRALPDVKLTASVLNRLLDMAETQGILTPDRLFKQFGVEKPVFKIIDLNQSSLF